MEQFLHIMKIFLNFLKVRFYYKYLNLSCKFLKVTYVVFLVSILQPTFVFKQLKMEGFIVNRWISRWTEGINQNLEWIKEGKLKYRETVTDGFENMYEAFVGMLRGENVGKAIVKA